ncbi:MAG: C2H2-type zinc finger protein [Candidatus Nanohaloarchaea archaeon]
MTEEERFECPECGDVFGSEEMLREHAKMSHGSASVADLPPSGNATSILKKLKPGSWSSFGKGFAAGFILAGLVLGGLLAWGTYTSQVPVTVVTCDNCSYDQFRETTSKMYNARYNEVDYRSERGQELIEKYGISYVPAFIIDKSVNETLAFKRVKSIAVEYPDAYVVPDTESKVAQQLSSGKRLEQ